MTTDTPTSGYAPFTDRAKAVEAGRKGGLAKARKRLEAKLAASQPPPLPQPATPQPEPAAPNHGDAVRQRRIEVALAAADALNPLEMRDTDRIRVMADALRDLAEQRGVTSDDAIREAYLSPPNCPHCGHSLL